MAAETLELGNGPQEFREMEYSNLVNILGKERADKLVADNSGDTGEEIKFDKELQDILDNVPPLDEIPKGPYII